VVYSSFFADFLFFFIVFIEIDFCAAITENLWFK